MTLTELSYYSRKFLPFFVLFFLVFLVLFYTVKLFFIYLQATKPKSVYLNPVFGKIKKPLIDQASESANINFILDTIEGTPVTATEAAQIYFLPPSITRFGYREKIFLMAKNLGFDTTKAKYKLLNDKEAVFDDGKQKLTVDITNFNFSYEYDVRKQKQIFTNVIIPSKNEIENKAINFMKTMGRYPDELTKGKTNLIFLNYNPLSNVLYVPTTSEGANVVEIDFYREDIGQFPVVAPKYFNSQNFIIMTFYEGGFKVLKAQIHFFEKSADQSGIYPIKSGETAWGELVAGKGVIISLPPDQKEAVIKKMFMAYLDQDIYQDYLQPVYVFLGDGNFVAYVPAIRSDYLSD